MGYSKNEKAACDFLRWVHSEPVFAEWFASPQGYSDAATRMWEKDKVWTPIRCFCRSATSRRRGMPAEAAVQWNGSPRYMCDVTARSCTIACC